MYCVNLLLILFMQIMKQIKEKINKLNKFMIGFHADFNQTFYSTQANDLE